MFPVVQFEVACVQCQMDVMHVMQSTWRTQGCLWVKDENVWLNNIVLKKSDLLKKIWIVSRNVRIEQPASNRDIAIGTVNQQQKCYNHKQRGLTMGLYE